MGKFVLLTVFVNSHQVPYPAFSDGQLLIDISDNASGNGFYPIALIVMGIAILCGCICYCRMRAIQRRQAYVAGAIVPVNEPASVSVKISSNISVLDGVTELWVVWYHSTNDISTARSSTASARTDSNHPVHHSHCIARDNVTFVIASSPSPDFPEDMSFLLVCRCTVCLDAYAQNDMVRILPCQHTFHQVNFLMKVF